MAKKVKVARPRACSPKAARDNVVDTGTCLSAENLQTVASHVLSGARKRAILSKTDLRVLVGRVHAALGTQPGHEDAWLSRVPRKLAEEIQDAFRPEHPAEWVHNPRQWLSTTDIESVMEQYEDAVRGFRFVGVFPRDFATKSSWSGRCVSEAMCALDVKSLLAQGVRCLGFVFNMDTHELPGSHWMALFAGIDASTPGRFGVFYYDSVAKAPPPEIHSFMASLRAQIGSMDPRMGKKFGLHWNTTRRQFHNTECGVFAISFLVACLTTKLSFQSLCERMGDDDAMFRLRNHFFRTPSR